MAEKLKVLKLLNQTQQKQQYCLFYVATKVSASLKWGESFETLESCILVWKSS